MANTLLYENYIKSPIFIGAAANKLIGIIKALRDNKCKSYLITLPILGAGSKISFFNSVFIKNKNGPQFFSPVFSNRYLRIIAGQLFFAWFCIFKVRSCDKVIFYNHSIEYILALFILVLKRNKPFLDIEDAPNSNERGWRRIVSPILFHIFFNLSLKDKFIISHELARALNLTRYCVLYGAVSENLIAYKQKHLTPLLDNPLVFHYGGSLTKDNGVKIFCDAVELLSKKLPRFGIHAIFKITGYWEGGYIQELKNKMSQSSLRVECYENIHKNKYLNILNECHVGLSLRVPLSGLATKTFPSKVVEITSNGLLLISTETSDIPILFNKNSAIILENLTEKKLAEAFLWCIKNRESVCEIAKNGQEIAIKTFNSRFVGKEILEFISNTKDPV